MAPFEISHPRGRELLGGDLVAQALKNLGVEVAFGIHGGHLDAFLVGAHDAGIRLVDTRHEAVAVQAAEGYAKISGRTGVCFVTANSGFVNALAGLGTAFADRSPIFCITSSPPLQDAETNALQGFHDQVVVAKPLTKFAHRVTNAEEIPRIVAYAYRAASVGIKGPVVVDFPIDVLFSPPQPHRIAYGAVDVPPANPPAPSPASLNRLLEVWKGAKRPIIITGTGIRGAVDGFVKLAENTNTPVFYSNKFSSPISSTHELRGGPATGLAGLVGEEQPDFVLLLAARTGFLLGGRGGAIIPKNATLAQVDLDGSEIGKTHPVQIGIIADAELFCDAFVTKASCESFPRHEGWIKTCRQLATNPLPFEKDPQVQKDGQLHPYHAMTALMRALPKDSIIMVDGGEAGQWAALTLEKAEPHVAIVPPGYLGCLGNGWGYSLGAAVADPSRLVVNIHGDGSAGFHIQELDTFARHRLNILTVVANNYVWGMSINGQDLVFEGKSEARPAVHLSKDCKYEIVAEGFNCAGKKVTQLEEIGPIVQEMSQTGRPGLINLIVSRTPTTPATLGMVGTTDDPNNMYRMRAQCSTKATRSALAQRLTAVDSQWIVVPYYDNVPRPYYRNSVPGEGSSHVH